MLTRLCNMGLRGGETVQRWMSGDVSIEIRYDKMLSLACSTSALLLQLGLDVLHNHDDIMIMYLILLSPYL